MMKSYKLNILISFIIVFCSSCEDYYNKRVVFTIQGIIADRKVVGQGESVNISASVSIQGAVNQNNVNYAWDCTAGEFNDRANQATIWTAPSDNTGEFLISLKVSFMGNTEEGEIAIKVVRTPAGNWGSISGNIFNYIKAPVQNIIVTTKTGESDTTDTDGFFYIEDIPQGGTGLEFSNIEFKWVTEPLGRIIVSGGTHDHLGDIILYPSEPPVILDYNENPGHQSLVSIKHDLPNLFEYFELYISYDPGGGGYRLLTTIAPGTTSITIKEDRDSAYIALKSIPNQGVSSDFSPWTRIYFTEVIDPDADRSSVEYNSFFSASITWELTGYEEYYKGFRVAEENDTGFVFISPLLSASAFQYTIETKPGMTGNYYVIAFTKSDTYNKIQPPGQIISLEVPSMEHPAGFKGSLQTVGDTPVKLSWEPISANTAWYSGYIIKKKTITETTESRWEELSLITSTFTGTITDVSVNYGNIYRYSIQTLSYPPGLGIPAYSEPDSITVEDLWEQTPFNDIIDPDAEMSFFRYNNFYIASLNWQPTGYEKYYKGFKVAREDEFSELSFVSPLLSVNTYNFEIKTSPGMTGDYYVIAITTTGSYNTIQPEEQKVRLEVPSMEFPSGFKGKSGTAGGINIKLSWEPIATDNTWYSGYLIEKKTITDTLEYEWEDLARIGNSFTESYTDSEIDSANVYKYSIRTISYPPGLGNPGYSLPDSIIVEPF